MIEKTIINHINDIFKQRYFCEKIPPKKSATHELVFLILSTRVTEQVYNRTYEVLINKYPNMEDLSKASTEDIASAIFLGGKYNQKARYIKEILKKIKIDFGSYDLEKLSRRSECDCEQYLLTLPGVGIKVARCLMLFSLDKEVFPVDSHCWRISKRIGIIKEKCLNTKGSDILQNRIPRRIRYYLHINMIEHGRHICRPHNPKCSDCAISNLCKKNI